MKGIEYHFWWDEHNGFFQDLEFEFLYLSNSLLSLIGGIKKVIERGKPNHFFSEGRKLIFVLMNLPGHGLETRINVKRFSGDA